MSRPFEELLDTGLLWLLNRSTLHPRGFAVQIVTDDDGKAIGWDLIGDGSEPFVYKPMVDDEKFAAVEAFLEAHR